MNLSEKISAWTEEKLETEALVQAIEKAAEDAMEHRNGFGAVVDDLTPEQAERCGDLVTFAFSLLDMLDSELQELLDGLEEENKGRVITAGDMIVRASFQLNQAFGEFRNQALAALGPTDIPNLNHLISVKTMFLADPNEQTKAGFNESIVVERKTTIQAIRDLESDAQIPEVVALTHCFKEHLGRLDSLAQDLAEQGPEADFEAHFAVLSMGFRELSDMVPAAQVAVRAQGETDFPDLNYLLSMIKQAEEATIGDGPVVEALHAVEAGFSDTYEKFQQALPLMESVLVKEEIEAAIKSFDDFREGVQATYQFLVERERFRLSQARGFYLDFAKALSGHKERLKELEALEGKITCPRCSTVNESERARCASCGSPLPQNVAASTTSTFETKESGGIPGEDPTELLMTSNMVKLYEAINAIHAGNIDDAAFLAEVEKFEGIVNANVNQLPAEPSMPDEQQQHGVNLVYDAFEEGVEKFRQGVELLRGYLDSRDEEALKDAILILDQGAKSIAAAGKAVSGAAAS